LCSSCCTREWVSHRTSIVVDIFNRNLTLTGQLDRVIINTTTILYSNYYIAKNRITITIIIINNNKGWHWSECVYLNADNNNTIISNADNAVSFAKGASDTIYLFFFLLFPLLKHSCGIIDSKLLYHDGDGEEFQCKRWVAPIVIIAVLLKERERSIYA